MDLEEEIAMLKKENEKLEEELSTLQEETDCLKYEFDDYKKFGTNDGDCVFDDMYGKIKEWGIMEDTTPKFMEMWGIVKKHYEELKDGENTAKMIDKLNKEFSELMDTNMKLEEQLKEANKNCAFLYIRMHALDDENKKLNKEIDEMFEATGMPDDMIQDGYTKLDAIYEWENSYAQSCTERIEELEEENKELKEKLKKNQKINDDDINKLEKLREAVRKELDVEPDPTQETIINTIKSLKGENEKLRENAELSKEFWSCLMDCRGNPDNPDKSEIDEWCDAYNKSDKIRDYLTEDLK